MKVFIVAAALLVSGCSTAAPPQRVVSPSNITYRVINLSRAERARAALTFQSGTNGIDQIEVTMPWETTFTISPGVPLYIAAQNVSEVGGIQVFILKNGREIATADAVGAYAIATATAGS